MKSAREHGSWRDVVSFMVCAVTALFGFAGGPWWSVIGSALLLTALNSEPWAALWQKARKVAAERAFAQIYLMSVAQNVFFCGLAFALGLALRMLVPDMGN